MKKNLVAGCQWIILLGSLWWAGSLHAETRQHRNVLLEGEFSQGGLLQGQAPAGSTVFWQKKALQTTNDGRFVLGFGRDEPVSQSLRVMLPSGKEEVIPVELASRQYQEQRVEGVPAQTVNPDPKHLERIRQEAAAVRQARDQQTEVMGFLQQFIWPLQGPITGVYGSRRIYNGEPRRPHFGVDIAAPQGTEILAPADGVVSLAYQAMFFSGDTLIIDHGYGVSTSYLHMSKMLVKQGDQVKQGQVIGLVGATGRATGPHLCWRLNWFQTRLDPQLLVPAMPSSAQPAL